MIGKLLGHTQVQTTARYAHLARDTVKASAAGIGDSIDSDLAAMKTRRMPINAMRIDWSPAPVCLVSTPFCPVRHTARLAPTARARSCWRLKSAQDRAAAGPA